MKSYKIIVIACLVMVLCLSFLACNNDPGNTPTPSAKTYALHYAAGAGVTEEAMKADLAALLEVAEGTELSVSGTVDLAAQGKYTVTCTWGESTQEVAVNVYANTATFTYNGEPLTDGTRVIGASVAASSENFTKGISVVDCFGNALTLKLDSRNMSYAGKPGSYVAYYHATDAAGQTFTVRVLYKVEYDNQILASDAFAFDFEASVTVPVDFDGATNVWLEDSKGNKIDVRYYQLTDSAVVINKDFYITYLNSKITLRICSEYGRDDFMLTVMDKDGYNRYQQEQIEKLITYQSTYATFEIAKELPDAVVADYAFYYSKKPGGTIDKSALVWTLNCEYGYLSFDIYVHSVTSSAGAAQSAVEFQLYNGAKFVSVVDSNGNTVDIVDKNNKPNVVLTKGNTYHIVLDMSEAFRPEFYVGWSNKTAELYYYNIELNAPYYEYVIDDATQTIVCKKNGEELGYFAWPTVTKLDGDRLIAVSSGFRKAHIDTESKVAVWYSKDGGKTWSEPQVLVDTLLDDRDSGVVYWNGKIIVSWFCASKEYYIKYNASKYTEWANTIDEAYDTKYMGGNYIISEDGGKTWSEIYTMPEGMFTPHGLIVNPEGGLTSVGYLKYDKVSKRWGTGIAVRTTTGEMNENGFVWSDPIIIADSDTQYTWDFQEPYGIYNDDGVLIVVMRSDKGLYQCELKPGESAFSEWHKIAFVQESPAHMFRHSSGVLVMTYGYRGLYIDPVTGNSVNYKDRNKDTVTYGIRARLSYDDGLTWTREVILTSGLQATTSDNTSDWGYTSSVELSDGKLLTLYYQRTGSETKASIYQVVWSLPEAFEGEVTVKLVNGMNTLVDDGALISSVVGQVGEAIELPEATKSGYTLEGWYLDCACSIPFMGETYSQDLTLYAKWVKQ